jgi:hypothetical protein
MSGSLKRTAFARRSLLAVAGSLGAWVTDCDYTEYPIEPTFCDDWCHVLLARDCDQEPENCVRNCERSLAPAGCFELQKTLLACYQSTPTSEFTCSGQGFQSFARPDENACPSERDALIDCAYPSVKLCLDVCRGIETDAGADAGDAGNPEGRICPSHDMPCDSICWAGAELYSDVDAAALDAGTAQGVVSLVLECAVERAETCRTATGEVEDANWASVLSDCIDDLGL